MKTVLTIAGSDSGGGAGIQADLKTFAVLGVHGLSAITTVTAQNTVRVVAAQPLPIDIIVAQIDAVAADFDIDAVKTGMLCNVAIVEAVAACVRRLALPFLVVDPVIRASSGSALLDDDAIQHLTSRLLPEAYCVTPNQPEAERLSGISIETNDDARDAAKRIARLGPRTVVITGGHRRGPRAVDLVYDGSGFTELSGPRLRSSTTHGTGCTFSAALAAGLAEGMPLTEAARKAKAFVADAIRRATPLGAGQGPVRQV